MVVNLVYAAQRRVCITTPYFIPSQSLQEAMETAAVRGVDVHLIVDRRKDQFMVANAQRSYYESLLAAEPVSTAMLSTPLSRPLPS